MCEKIIVSETYQDLYSQSINQPEQFWADAAQAISWSKPWDKVLDDSNIPYYRWFKGAKLNTCYNAVDRHVEDGIGDQTAIIYDSPVTDTKQKISFSELQQQVAKMAGAMANCGVVKGDRVVIYMPMIPQTLVGMLACARLGAIHSVVFGGFAANELATRIDDAKPKVVLSASCGIEPNRIVAYKPLLDDAIDIATHKPDHTIICQRPQLIADMTAGRDLDWQQASDAAQPHPCVEVEATDPLYILYTSGTTGQPKGVVRDNGGHAVALAWSMKHIYNVKPGEVFWAASDVGWVVGHSFICYGPLINGSTTVLFEGKPIGTPDAGTFWRVIEEYQVKSFFTAPTAFRAIKGIDPDGDFIKKYDLSCLSALYLAGERCDPATLTWAQDKLQVPVIDHWWQTETGWPVAANLLGSCPAPVKAGSPSRPVPGYEVEVVDPSGEKVATGESGMIVIKLPLPPGTLPTLWQNDQRYFDAYLSQIDGYYLTGDAGYIDEDNYLWIMNRIDDVINVAGHRLSTGRLEEALSNHPSVAEAAVIGVKDDLKGELPLGLVVLSSDCTLDHREVQKQLIKQVRDEVGPVAAFKLIAVVDKLPKTRSGKILRATMKNIANGDEYGIPATIEDASVLDSIESALHDMGYAQ
ncbi:MAG: propionyl-CoA synthetase [Gammaproteobacteria bacterium]|nr:propionyl-CoA synthetase [Gammaproteobacteria bacterium]